jgi:hypothetical protein
MPKSLIINLDYLLQPEALTNPGLERGFISSFEKLKVGQRRILHPLENNDNKSGC